MERYRQGKMVSRNFRNCLEGVVQDLWKGIVYKIDFVTEDEI